MTLPPIKTTINDHTVFIEKLSDEDGEFWMASVFTCKKHGMPIICQGNSYKEALDFLRTRLDNLNRLGMPTTYKSNTVETH